jgi:WhiB family transcriptional regulator, redox-sensing transcriptional regulator
MEVAAVTDSDWRRRAACQDLDPELFFPIGTTGSALDQANQAKTVCARCPVIEACLEWALNTNQQNGVWGGTTEDERRALQRKRRRKPKT